MFVCTVNPNKLESLAEQILEIRGVVTTRDLLAGERNIHVEVVTMFYEVGPADLGPSYTVIDPDALDLVFAPSPADRSLNAEVRFQRENVGVSEDGDGTMCLSDPG